MFNNKDHLHTTQTNVGEVTFIHTSRQNRPKELSKPYEYILPINKTNDLIEELDNFLYPKELPNVFAKRPKNKPEGIYQCSGIRKKPVSKGIKLNIFVLGCSEKVKTETVWLETCNYVQDVLQKYLGKDAKIYADKFNKENKFQIQFETYIMFEENYK